jgi:Pyruvate/2-oxoacid:ferredoxin oxidoreductase delta subunit
MDDSPGAGFCSRHDHSRSICLFFALSSAILLLALSFIWFFNQKIKAAIPQRALVIGTGTALAIIGIGTWQVFAGDTSLFFVQDYQLRSWYGFYIGSVFAGVVGTGFYPLMGNRVWCRFGCPLAAYLGLVQRIRSKFRITVNGSQCISCGNCSTYCEMGIDVRAYAQKGQDILRSSCVGCGICAAVCPRGVLKLENGSADIHERAHALRAIHISETEVKLMH